MKFLFFTITIMIVQKPSLWDSDELDELMSNLESEWIDVVIEDVDEETAKMLSKSCSSAGWWNCGAESCSGCSGWGGWNSISVS